MRPLSISLSVALCAAFLTGSCNRLSFEERQIVGKWSWSSGEAKSEYIFNPDRSLVVLLPDKPNDTGKIKPEIYGAWAFELGFLILEYRSGTSTNFAKKKDRLPVSKISQSRIALRDGTYFERVRD